MQAFVELVNFFSNNIISNGKNPGVLLTVGIIIIIIIITLFKSQIVLAEHECSTNWGDCKSNKL